MATKTDWPKRLRAIREARGWTQDVLADRLGFSHRASVSLFESGKRQPRGPIKRLIEMLEKEAKK